MGETYSLQSELWNCEVSESDTGGITLHLAGRMEAGNSAGILKTLDHLLQRRSMTSLVLDLEGISYLDDFGALVLFELKHLAARQQADFKLVNAKESVSQILTILKFESLDRKASFEKKPSPDLFVRLGGAALRLWMELRFLISFTGSVFLQFLHLCYHPKKLRMDDTILCMQRTGVDALPIVVLISFLMGLIMAFMSAVQLEKFGANIYVASLVSLSMTRELGPIMTAIIVAGRSGSAFAAELGTMKISEEVDALFTMGFEPTRFLVIPKLIAAAIVVPFLTLFSDLAAILGGLLVGVGMLDLTPGGYISQTIWTLTLFDVFWGFGKSAVFAILITWIACFRGFRARGGAASVGEATTSAVVSSLFLIILTDSLFSVILRYWG
jgi:phospholipid/cholesterol/gamma-HCH transport system permease protein